MGEGLFDSGNQGNQGNWGNAMPREYQGAATETYRKLYGFKKLIAWQKADDLAATVHEITAGWGSGYLRLAEQMRSAAVSAKSNIAEGYCRASLGDYVRFCEIARGSLGELGSQIQGRLSSSSSSSSISSAVREGRHGARALRSQSH
jgi:four helix bundle protein